ncbi:Glycosyltransferase Gtf1 [bioreactor metagenome]|uniref:Glycosyltransferase Gtf1 n=1 Tax=bioreactor metagenome TaxID=1076179 RepID=A0A644ZNL5_9ZZZZ
MSNIMIITQSLTGGGAEKLAANLSLELSKNNVVTVVTFREDISEFEYAGCRINLNLPGGQGGFLSQIYTALLRILNTKKIKRDRNIDCSISFLPQTDYVNVLSKRKKEKTIINVVSNMSYVYPAGLKKTFRQLVIKLSDFVITVSEGVRQDLIDHFNLQASGSKTIYNSCDLHAIKLDCIAGTEFERLCEELPDRFICSMGSFRLAKGHWHLIKAFSTISDSIPDYKLVILGDGPYREKYLDLINILRLKERIILPGFANPPYSIICKSKLFVFSSIYEGFGNSIIEAMACGVPILSTDCDYGAREILSPNSNFKIKANDIEESDYGFLLPPFSTEDIDVSEFVSKNEILMGKAILEVLSRDNKELIARALKYVEIFDNVNYGNAWKDVIRRVLNE